MLTTTIDNNVELRIPSLYTSRIFPFTSPDAPIGIYAPLSVDRIKELTPGQGVNIERVVLRNGSITVPGAIVTMNQSSVLPKIGPTSASSSQGQIAISCDTGGETGAISDRMGLMSLSLYHPNQWMPIIDIDETQSDNHTNVRTYTYDGSRIRVRTITSNTNFSLKNIDLQLDDAQSIYIGNTQTLSKDTLYVPHSQLVSVGALQAGSIENGFGAVHCDGLYSDTIEAKNTSNAITVNSNLLLTQGLQVLPKTVTAPFYSVTATDFFLLLDTTSNAITITLPTANEPRVLHFKDKRGTCDIQQVFIRPRNFSEKIDGAEQYVLNSRYASLVLYCDGDDNWYILL